LIVGERERKKAIRIQQVGQKSTKYVGGWGENKAMGFLWGRGEVKQLNGVIFVWDWGGTYTFCENQEWKGRRRGEDLPQS